MSNYNPDDEELHFLMPVTLASHVKMGRPDWFPTGARRVVAMDWRVDGWAKVTYSPVLEFVTLEQIGRELHDDAVDMAHHIVSMSPRAHR
jgi:hypothetical protein